MAPLHPVPRKAIALGVLVAALIVGFAAGIIWKLRVETRDIAVRNGHDVLTSIAHDVERTVDSYDLSMQSVVVDVASPALMSLPPEVRHRVLFDASIRARYLGPILVLDEHGSVVVESADSPRSGDFGGQDFFEYHRTHAGQRLHIGHPFRAPSGEYRVPLSHRVTTADGRFGGVVVGTIEVAYFLDLFSRIDLGDQGLISIVLDDGTMLARSPFRDIDVGRSLRGTRPYEEMRLMGSGAIEGFAATDGVERLFTFQPIGALPLLLSVAQSTHAVYGSWQDRAMLISGLTLLLLAGCGGLALILRRELALRYSVETRLFAETEQLQVTLRSIDEAVVTTDRDGRILFMNPAAEAMSGWTIDRARGMRSEDVLPMTASGDSNRPFDPIAAALARDCVSARARDSTLHRTDGHSFAVEVSVSPIRDTAGRIVGAVTVLHDVTETRAMADRMEHLAQHDTLTDLPNRLLFHDRLGEAIDRATSNQRKVAVLFLDLDRFKHVNDSLGHRAGDHLLIEMARRLEECVRDADTVSRQGGDEFVVLLADLTDDQGPARVAESILRRLSQPFRIEGHSLTVTASLGVAIFPDDGRDVGALTKHADAAMYLAKQSGRNGFRFFTSELGDLALQHLNFEHRIAAALEHAEFILHYQPLCRAYDGLPIGAEALVRWRRDGVIVPPSDFIPIAEECGQIVVLGETILRMACRQAVLWNERRTEPFVISVNVSAHQFRDSGFVELVVAVLRETGLAAPCLELEITESVFLDDVERTETVLRQLKQIGVSIALDDFGTGYSSLSYLSRFQVDRIKIDRSFVQTLATHPRNKAIVQTIISLGHQLGLKVIAEGVETVEQRKILSALGCLELQGYLFGRPGPDFTPGIDLDDDTDETFAMLVAEADARGDPLR